VLKRLDWNQPIPDDLQKFWNGLILDLNELNNLSIPRYVWTSPQYLGKIHGFADASERAYGCYRYFRVKIEGKGSVNLLIAKARVSPIKVLTLPRLELCAAVLLNRTFRKFQHKLTPLINGIYFWSDPNVVLQWMATHALQLNCFVPNRVSELQQHSSAVEW